MLSVFNKKRVSNCPKGIEIKMTELNNRILTTNFFLNSIKDKRTENLTISSK
jgi:hypothetical protein